MWTAQVVSIQLCLSPRGRLGGVTAREPKFSNLGISQVFVSEKRFFSMNLALTLMQMLDGSDRHSEDIASQPPAHPYLGKFSIPTPAAIRGHISSSYRYGSHTHAGCRSKINRSSVHTQALYGRSDAFNDVDLSWRHQS